MTLPADLYDLPSMEAVLTARGDPLAVTYQCPCCPRVEPPRAIACTDGLPGGLPRFACYTCASGPFREAKAAEAQAAAHALGPWQTEAAATCRIERDRRVNACLWTSDPAAPLTDECRAAWAIYRAQLHSVTIDFADPAAVVWPAEPALAYCSNPV